MNKYILIYLPIVFALFSCKGDLQQQPSKHKVEFLPLEVNHEEIPVGSNVIAIVGVSLFDGLEDSTIHNSTVIVRNGLIDKVGPEDALDVPENADVIKGDGLTLMPGLIDAHFHYDHVKHFPTKFVRNGVTSVRDPGQWIEAFDFERGTGDPLPRLFLTGPHIDSPPPTWPKDSYMVRDKAEVKEAMDYLIGENVSAIKIYHRLPLELIKEVCDIAHAHGLPVTAHLEITDVRQAVLAGLDGVEHVTSLGTALVSRKRAEEFRQGMLANNKARLSGRLEMWKDIDVNGKRADSLIKFFEANQTFLTPTLGPYEYKIEGENKDSIALIAFQNMSGFIGRCAKANVRIAVGSHGPWVPYAEKGWSFQHEMDLLSKTGMDNVEIMKASTIENAKFLKIDHRLGSIEKGKQADLLLIKGDPVTNIKDMYNIERVMLNGIWLDKQ
ncbi:amidohydrolase family protein [Arenibacter sp. F26102]|uniref:amidohydrolase family protein n=1 Tax=Arenibacter sp. F26102 TaxID=2926416 RepID=UPI001FF326CA|nr:amidohydrolase family protein [Arenibacter sp. F26102]MCK0147202.1 amidohydrolase family protein [Arenibacter sp. F26102]